MTKLTLPSTLLAVPTLSWGTRNLKVSRNSEDRGSSTTLGLGFLLFLAVHGSHTFHPVNQYASVKVPHPHGCSLVSNQLVFSPLPVVDVDAFVVEPWVVPPPISKLLFLVFIEPITSSLSSLRLSLVSESAVGGVGGGVLLLLLLLALWWFISLGVCCVLNSSANSSNTGIQRGRILRPTGS